MDLATLSKKLEQLKGKQKEKQDNLAEFNRRLSLSKKEKIRWERARELLKEIGLKTQQQLQFHISNLTSMAMEAVFDDPYTVKIEFIPKRNKTECEITFQRQGTERDPMEQTGFGAADVCGFALRIAALCIQKQKARPILLLDEPFKHLKGEEPNQRAIQMMKEISDRLGFQIISVSDERASLQDIEKGADKIFYIQQNKTGRSILSNNF